MDKIWYNGKIYSIDNENHRYTAIGIDDGKIAFLGNDEEAAAIACNERFNLQGKTVLPGFIDSHIHMLNYAFIKKNYDMSTAGSIGEIIETGKAIINRMEKNDHETWVFGRGWNETNFTDEKRPLTRDDLDKISTENPVFFIRVCGHQAVVNTVALEKILRIEESKALRELIDVDLGILTEVAVKLCYQIMKEPDVNELKDMIRLAQNDIVAYGITGVGSDNFLSLPGRNGYRIMQAYRELEEEGSLKIRVSEQASFAALNDLERFLKKGYQTGQGGEYYEIGPVKLYQDGSLGAKTALMREPYLGEDTSGVMVHTQEELDAMVDLAYKNEMQILTHAIGDAGGEMVCKAYEKAILAHGERDSRLGINHLQVVSDEILDKMKLHHILAYIQPIFVGTDKARIESLIGKEKSRQYAYIWKTMIDKGIICCGSSDSPVEGLDILEGIQLAVTRDCIGEKSDGWNSEEKLSVLEAVKLFTVNNAYAMFCEHKRGTLEIGKDADMVVLSEDIFEVEPHLIHTIKIEKTMVNGNIVYNREA